SFCTIIILQCAFFNCLRSAGYFLFLWAQPVVTSFYIFQVFGAALVCPLGRKVAFNAPCFQIGIVLPTAVAGVCQEVLPDHSLLSQPPVEPCHGVLQILVVLLVGVVSLHIGNHVAPGIYAYVAQVVELSCLPGLDTYSGIGIGRTIMGLVSGVTAALVLGSRAHIVFFAPSFVASLDLL